MFTPPCNWVKCASIITSVGKVCFVGSTYGYLVVSLSGALSIFPPHRNMLCVTCRTVIGKAYPKPDLPPLPQERVQETTPFSVTGVDL
jgi:hypothetical protein